MALRSGFFNSVNGDRKYKADRFAEYFATFIGNGVFPNPSTGLQVYANDDMTVTVKPGQGWINGYIVINDDDYNLQIEPADGVLNRIDRVVLRYDTVDREIRLEIKKGTFASTPIAPVLQRDADAHELGLADVYVGKGIISITQANITDLRLNTGLCGIVHGTVNQVDTTTLFDQYLSWYQQRQAEYEANLVNWTTDKQNQYDTWTANKQSEYNNWYDTTTTNAEQDIGTIKQDFQASFDTWFAGIQGVLDGDIAGNLLNIIEDHKDAAAPHSGHETPAGAQAKANAAETAAKEYTNQEVASLAQEVDEHLAEYTQLKNATSSLVKVKRNVVILAENWANDTEESGYWVYELLDDDIDENVIIDVNIHLEDLENAEGIKPVTVSSEGKVTLFADEMLEEDIVADLKLIRQVGE